MVKFFSFFLFLATETANTGAQQIGGISDSTEMVNRNSVVANGARLQLIANRFSFTEGPATDKKGNVFFTDQPNNKIWKYSTRGKLSIFMENAGRSNGMYFDKHGNLITCADEHNELWSISPSGKITVLLKEFKGLHFNGPNDVWVHSDGSIFFTDPYYQRDYWTRKAAEIDQQKVYCLLKNNSTVAVADDLIKPNGIIGTPDGKYLYVADIGAGKTYRYNIGDGGSLTGKILFAEQGSDGMTIDEKGNIYLTGKGVTVYNPQGGMIEHIDVPAPWTSNVTFGGRGKNLLFITASAAVYILKMKLKGAL
jgi:gluconolactonase